MPLGSIQYIHKKHNAYEWQKLLKHKTYDTRRNKIQSKNTI